MYQRLASDVDLEEDAEITQLEGPSPAVVPTVMGVEAGRTTLEAAVRAGAIIVETAFFGGGGRGDDGRGPAEVLRTPECNRTRVRAEATPSVPRKTKRMDRRLTHWQCAFCRSETALSEESDRCRKCNGPREQLGDADAEEREKARRASRQGEAHGRKLNARGTGSERIPRAALGVFEAARHDALVRLETTQLEQATGAVGYLIKEECNVGIIESFLVVHRGAQFSLMDEEKRKQLTAAVIADFWNTIGRRVTGEGRAGTCFRWAATSTSSDVLGSPRG